MNWMIKTLISMDTDDFNYEYPIRIPGYHCIHEQPGFFVKLQMQDIFLAYINIGFHQVFNSPITITIYYSLQNTIFCLTITRF